MRARPERCVEVYDSRSPAYHDAFKVFLAHTDQKARAREKLDHIVDGLPRKRVFIDAGAGNGKVTAWFAPTFEQTIALEPNASLRAELEQTCPDAEVLPHPVLEARPGRPGDLVLCSHVLYYIDDDEWMATIEKLASWVAPGGSLTVIIQHHNSDCMKMLDRFFDRHFNLEKTAEKFRRQNGSGFEVRFDTVASKITAPDFHSACTIAEFMLNLLPMKNPPLRADLECYVQERFSRGDRGYEFSCDQAFLQIRPR